MMKIIRKISFRHLQSTQKGSFSTFAGLLAIGGLGIGIAALILTFSILEGFETTISEKIAGFDGHARLQHFMGQPISDENSDVDAILSAIPDLTVISYIQKPALLRKGRKAEGVIVEGIDILDQRLALSEIIVDGTPTLNKGSVILGKRLAGEMGLSIGDDLALFDMNSMVNVSANKRVKSFTITGLFHSGLLEYDQSVVYLSLSDAQTLFGMEGLITGKMLLFAHQKDVAAGIRNIDSQLEYPWYILSWKEKHRVLFEWIRVQRWPILIIFGMIAFVGIVNIISAMAMIVLEKIREIGVLRSIGFTRKMIRKLFLIEGAIIGTGGAVFGALVSLIFIWLQIRYQLIGIPEDVYFMDQIPMVINIRIILTIGLFGVFVSVLAALWPSFTAGRIRPADALRYE